MENMMPRETRVLRIDASGRRDGSSTRKLADDLIAALDSREGRLSIVRRDLASPLPHVDEAWIEANFTAAEERDAAQRESLRLSDDLVAELEAADVLVIGMPIYNFGVPAALKAWIDMIARARKTFRYTENGPVGLLEGKKAYLVVASGGVPVDSPVDFATPYMRHALAFVGITDVEVIAAEQQNSRGEAALNAARTQISEIVAGRSSAQLELATA
jgi:FMN-dependent NADH-azoreductase